MSDADQSGRDRIGRNVLTSWLSHLVFIAFGFITPRVIDEAIGQVSLGIWDLAWSVVSYLSVAMLGIGGSVNRFVARYRATADTLALSRTVSSVIAIQLVIASFVFLIVVVLAQLIPKYLGEQLGDQAQVAADVVFLLGAATAVQMAFDVFRGILTGCHRWTVYNGLNAISYSIAATGMIVALLAGGGLKDMAAVFLTITIMTEIVRVMLARSICPEIEYGWKHVNLIDTKKVFRFGIKSVLIFLPRVIIQQTVNVFVVATLGPAMLAVLARPLALVGHIRTLVNKFAFVLTPTAGSLQGGGRTAELKEFTLITLRAAWIFTVIPSAFMFVLGDRLIELWMGAAYSVWPVVAVLTLGSMVPMANSSLVTTMIGMDEHGRIARLSAIVSIVVILIGILILSITGWSLLSAAILHVLPSFIGIGLVALVVGCRVLKISAAEYLTKVMKDPTIVFMLTIVALWLVRVFGPQSAAPSLLLGMAVHGSLVLMILRKDLLPALRSLRIS